jgi:hypothetical protein
LYPHLTAAARMRQRDLRKTAFRGDRPALFFAGRFQALIDMGCAIPGQDFRLVSFMVAFHHFDLFGTPLQRGFAIFRRHGIRIDELLSEARLAEYERCDKS